MTPTFGSLFSGIGGLDLGLERAGWECRWQVEKDVYCNKVLEKHWPNVKRYEDVKEVHGAELAPVGLICGGFPCQPVSTAGQRKGDADARWLWPEFYRIISEVKPRWVLVENVPGLLSIDSGRLFGGILRDLADGGYDAEWDCIPAAAVGAPHLRYRVFLVAHTDGAGCRKRCRSKSAGQEQRSIERSSEALADTDAVRCDGQGESKGRTEGRVNARRQLAPCGEEVAYNDGQRQLDADWWAVEPDVGRMAHGVPSRVDRLRSLGNAVVPQVAEYVGRAIMASHRGESKNDMCSPLDDSPGDGCRSRRASRSLQALRGDTADALRLAAHDKR